MVSTLSRTRKCSGEDARSNIKTASQVSWRASFVTMTGCITCQTAAHYLVSCPERFSLHETKGNFHELLGLKTKEAESLSTQISHQVLLR